MGGSGGGSSGSVAYPAYIQTIHGLWLDNAGVDVPTNSIVDAINTAYAANPFTGVVAFNPDTALANADTAVAALNTLIDAYSMTTDFVSAYNQARTSIVEEVATLDTTTLDTTTINNTDIVADINEYSTTLEQQLNDQTLPNFRAGLLNIGAVHSSAFVVGEAVIRSYKQRDVARYGAELRGKIQVQLYDINARHTLSFRQLTAQHANVRRQIEAQHKVQRGDLVRVAVTTMISELLKRADLEVEVARFTVEANRIRIVAKKEQSEGQMDFDEREGKWQPELFAYGQNLLAGPSGGVHQNQSRPSKAVSALGGALSGAAAGGVVGGFPGAAVGAVLGAGLSLLS